jgi:hypothetical protein
MALALNIAEELSKTFVRRPEKSGMTDRRCTAAYNVTRQYPGFHLPIAAGCYISQQSLKMA